MRKDIRNRDLDYEETLDESESPENEEDIEKNEETASDEYEEKSEHDEPRRTKAARSRKNKRKRNTVFALMGCLAVMAVSCVSVAVVTAKAQSQEPTELSSSGDSELELKASQVQYFVEEKSNHVEFDELETEIGDIIENTKAITGGEWSVYIYIPSLDDTLSINQKKMQAASVIKLFVMGAVYDEYDKLKEDYPDEDIDSLIESMIIISDNEAADWLVSMLGRGDSAEGRKKVTSFCKSLGLNNTVMDRMMGDDNIYSDNYTTTEDTGKFLNMIYNGDFKHSKEMIHYLENQTRTNKIPAGVPREVKTANKTGELDDCQNDAAVVYAKRPYIICVMADETVGYQEPIDGIVDISTAAYNYIVQRL